MGSGRLINAWDSSTEIKLSVLSAAVARMRGSDFEESSLLTTFSMLMCSMLAALGIVSTIDGADGAASSQYASINVSPRSDIPREFHAAFPSSKPVFSNERLRSKTFFSWRICSIVILEADELPVSGGKPASLRNVSKVLILQNVSAPYHAGIFGEDRHLVIVICSQIASYDYGRGIEVRHCKGRL